MKTPNAFTLFRRANTAFDHLTLYVLTPHFKVNEDYDYETVERGVTRFEARFDTAFRWEQDKHSWTLSGRVLGFGLTLVRQKGY